MPSSVSDGMCASTLVDHFWSRFLSAMDQNETRRNAVRPLESLTDTRSTCMYSSIATMVSSPAGPCFFRKIRSAKALSNGKNDVSVRLIFWD